MQRDLLTPYQVHLKRAREQGLCTQCVPSSQGALVLEVLVQEGPSVLIFEGRLYLKGAYNNN